MARARGSKNVKPTRVELAGYYQALKQKAAQGDTHAAFYLIELSQRDSERQPIELTRRG